MGRQGSPGPAAALRGLATAAHLGRVQQELHDHLRELQEPFPALGAGRVPVARPGPWRKVKTQEKQVKRPELPHHCVGCEVVLLFFCPQDVFFLEKKKKKKKKKK